MRVLLIAGGWSNEREVSLKGARQIHAALEELGHTVLPFDLNDGFQELARQATGVEFAFINLHGLPGEDGCVQALLQSMGVPYQGAGPRGSLMALNKALAKQIFINSDLPTPRWQLLPPQRVLDLRVKTYPAVLKPNTGGSSLGLEILRNDLDLERAKASLLPGVEFILEDFVSGLEMTCAILGDRALPPILIRPKRGAFFDYKSKYEQGGAEEICPAPISAELTSTLKQSALEAHQALGLKDYSRTDFIVDSGDRHYLLETNTLPGMTETSLVPRAAAAAGIDFPGLIRELIRLGLQSKKGE
ncbi:MAG: D-alanine--D-alanine ligase [Desulfonatronovibrionaceae bacterium]